MLCKFSQFWPQILKTNWKVNICIKKKKKHFHVFEIKNAIKWYFIQPILWNIFNTQKHFLQWWNKMMGLITSGINVTYNLLYILLSNNFSWFWIWVGEGVSEIPLLFITGTLFFNVQLIDKGLDWGNFKTPDFPLNPREITGFSRKSEVEIGGFKNYELHIHVYLYTYIVLWKFVLVVTNVLHICIAERL